MTTFSDKQKREFTIDVNCTLLKRVLQESKINLSDVPIDDELQNKLCTDDVFLFDVIYAMCRPQCMALEIDQENFGNALDGDCFELAKKAFWGALLDFFRGHKKVILEAAMTAREQFTKQLREKRDQSIEKMVEWAKQEVDQSLATLGSASGNSQELSESIPGP